MLGVIKCGGNEEPNHGLLLISVENGLVCLERTHVTAHAAENKMSRPGPKRGSGRTDMQQRKQVNSAGKIGEKNS